MREVDVFVYTHDAYMGDITDQTIDISAGDVYTLKGPVNVRGLWFKNKSAGDNTNIVISGVTLSDQEMLQMGLMS